MSRVLRLTLLAPDIIESTLDGAAAGGASARGSAGGVSGGVGRAAETVRLTGGMKQFGSRAVDVVIGNTTGVSLAVLDRLAVSVGEGQ